MPLSETASHPEHRIRDVVSAGGLVRKACPTLKLDSGIQLPPETSTGNRIPLWSQNPGRIFRLRGDPESAYHSEHHIRARLVISARTSRQTKSAWHLPCSPQLPDILA